jgi:hypothetical protein
LVSRGGALGRLTALFLLLWSAGCLCRDPWTRYPNAVPPDHSYSTGGSVYGDDVYVWDCLEGKHIVVHQFSAEMSCSAAEREIVACGALTEFERRVAHEAHRPERRGWR